MKGKWSWRCCRKTRSWGNVRRKGYGEDFNAQSLFTSLLCVLISFSSLSALQKVKKWPAGDQAKRFPPAAGLWGAAVRSLPQNAGADLWPWRTLRWMPAARLQRLSWNDRRLTQVEMQRLCQDFVSVSAIERQDRNWEEGWTLHVWFWLMILHLHPFVNQGLGGFGAVFNSEK